MDQSELTAPGLIIALGRTALNAAGLIYNWRHSGSRTSEVGLIGLDFGAAPEGFPSKNFVGLTLDPAVRLDTPHHDQYAPRPLERLSWFDALSTGEESALFRLWKSQLPRTAQTVLVYVVADVGEPCGSSLILDTVNLTRELAARYRQNVAIVGYTVLPGEQADDADQLRAYVALREMEQAVTCVDPRQDIPNVKPFDAWYCIERSGSSAETLAEIVNVYLGRQANETKRQRMVNVSGRIAHGGSIALVGTATIQSVVLPVRALQHYWALGLAYNAVHRLMESDADAQMITRYRKAFWTGFPTGSLEWTLFNQRLRIAHRVENKPLEERVAELDRLFFPTQSIAPAAFSTRSLRLRGNLRDDGGDVAEALDRAEAMLHLFGAQGGEVSLSADDNAYLKLIMDAVETHRRLFVDRLHSVLAGLLKKDGLTSAQRLLMQIDEEILAARANFEQLRTSPTDNEAYAHLHKLKAALGEASRNLRPIGRRRLREQLRNFEDCLTAHLDQVRLGILLDQGGGLLDRMYAHIMQMQVQLSAWQSALSGIQQSYQSALEQAQEIAGSAKRISVIDSPDHPWAQRQRDRYVARIGGNKGFAGRLSWAITADDQTVSLDLRLDDAVILPDRPDEALLTRASEVFQDASSELDLLAYLNSLPPERMAQEIVKRLQGVEQSALPLVDSSDALQTVSGTLFTPLAERQPDRRTLRRIEAELKQTCHIPLTDNQIIHRALHDDPWRITYLFVTEFIKLRSEVKCYSELADRFRDQPDRIEAQRIFEIGPLS